MTSSDLAQDAQRMSLLFEYGVVGADQVISWADSSIVQLHSPADSLLELSTTAPSNTADILSCLHRLSADADFWLAFRRSLPEIRDFVATRRDRAEIIANYFFLTACNFDSDVPEDLHFVYRFDDAFALAREGTYGDPEHVYRDFINELDKFSQVP